MKYNKLSVIMPVYNERQFIEKILKKVQAVDINKEIIIIDDFSTDGTRSYKMFKTEVIKNIEFRENRFGFEPEFTIKVARGNWRICEVPISYYGRTYEEGKKINWKDGVRAIFCILRYSFNNASKKSSL